MEWVFPSVALTTALIGGYTDVRFGKVYNALTYPAMTIGMLLHGLTEGFPGLSVSAQGIGAGTAILLIPYMLGGVGGGDVKLLAAVGSFLGPGAAFRVMVLGAIIGGVLALGLLFKRRELAFTLLTLMVTPGTALRSAIGKRDFPFALTIALGLMATLLLGYLDLA